MLFTNIVLVEFLLRSCGGLLIIAVAAIPPILIGWLKALFPPAAPAGNVAVSVVSAAPPAETVCVDLLIKR